MRNSHLPSLLYRGLRREEISAGNILIPKEQKPFLAHPRLPNELPFHLGERLEHAVREHQWTEPDDDGREKSPDVHEVQPEDV